ncbi:protein-tyrosine phosphatase family protein [Spartinivicinus ruber]|uniref:protein-tyrosine phosphatase family protein n=1 Tax=Spartinivicinus ruber TaxID=2683272 RepID=UPI0013D889D7|nr:protein-tyrosine phosphatase family protein [Spartinivicinus ruber]
MADNQLILSLNVRPTDHIKPAERNEGWNSTQAQYKGSTIRLVDVCASDVNNLFKQSQESVNVDQGAESLNGREFKILKTDIKSSIDNVNYPQHFSESRISKSPDIQSAAAFWRGIVSSDTRIIIGLNNTSYKLQHDPHSQYGNLKDYAIVTKTTLDSQQKQAEHGVAVYEKKITDTALMYAKFNVENHHIEGALRTINIKQVNAFNFTQWPDKGIISKEQLQELIESINVVRQEGKQGQGNLLVHSVIQDGRSEVVVIAEKLFQLKQRGELNKETLCNTIDDLITNAGLTSLQQQELLQEYGRLLFEEAG